MSISVLNILQVLVAISLVGFILIQRGPGATAGSAFGAGASGTVFGSRGSGSFLTKTTAILATLFFIITMAIAIDARSRLSASDADSGRDLGVMGTLSPEEQTDVPTLAPVPGSDIDGVDIEPVSGAAADKSDQITVAGQDAVDAVMQDGGTRMDNANEDGGAAAADEASADDDGTPQ